MVSSPDDKGVIIFGGKHWNGTWNLYNGTYPNQFLELRYGDNHNQWRKFQNHYSISGKIFWLYLYRASIQFVFEFRFLFK